MNSPPPPSSPRPTQPLRLLEAVAIADDVLREIEESSSNTLSLTGATLHESGWAFTYNTDDYLITRSFTSLLGGNGPVLVRHDRSVIRVPVTDDLVEHAGEPF